MLSEHLTRANWEEFDSRAALYRAGRGQGAIYAVTKDNGEDGRVYAGAWGDMGRAWIVGISIRFPTHVIVYKTSREVVPQGNREVSVVEVRRLKEPPPSPMLSLPPTAPS